VGWLPSGFSIWSGTGTYNSGTIGVQTGSCSRIYPSSSSCWGVNIVSQYGCRDDAFVSVNIYDSSGAVVDTGIDQIRALVAGQVATAHGDTFSASAASFRVSKVDCFDF
jgi:hypothetical protein